MTLSILNKYFPCHNEVYNNRLMNLFEQLERCDNLFYALIIQEAGKYKLAYTSPSAAWLTGYSMENFSYEDGFSFIYSITPRSFRKEILDQETYIFIKAREAELDISKPFFGYINGGFEKMDGRILPARMLCAVLEFTAQRTPYLSINTWHIVDGLPEAQCLKIRAEVESILTGIHEVYALLFDLKVSGIKADDPLRLACPIYHLEELTKQEYRVLKLLADGLSSKAIAGKLNISYHTAESHRKHLLRKFEAANVAEMIKKATKLYWLE